MPPPLGEKVKYSVDLIRKSEKIALRYDPEDGFYNTFSGGKDSQVLYHIVKMSGVKFKSHMSLTSIDPPQVIRFVRSEYPDVEMEKPKMSIFQDAIKRKILPTMKIRWCCADFKETAGAGKVTLIGIRAEESSRRAKRHEVEISNKKFSGNIEQFEEYQQEAVAKKMKTLKRKLNEDEFSLVNENEVRCVGGKDSILVSPIFKWTEKDVWTFLNTLGIKHCELYDQGYHRIGCILCPMSQPKQKRREVKDFSHVKRGWIKAIKAIRRGGGYNKDNLSVRSRTATYGGTSHELVQSGTLEATCGTGNAQLPPPSGGKFGKQYNAKDWNSGEMFLPRSVRREHRKEFLPGFLIAPRRVQILTRG